MRNDLKILVLGAALAGLAFASPSAAKSDDGSLSKNRGADRPRMERARDDGFARDLTDAQREQMKALRKSFQKEMEPLRKKAQKDAQAVADKLKSGATDDQLKPLLDRLAADHEALGSHRREHQKAIRGILTPTQQARQLTRAMEKAKGFKGRQGKRNSNECPWGLRDGDDDSPARRQFFKKPNRDNKESDERD